MIDPVFSIIIPVYNREAGVRRAIGSIQPTPDTPCEIVIVDDGSSDGTAAAARAALAASGLPGEVIEQPNAGPGVARNTGAARAQGRWLVFLDSDDAWFPWTLGRLADVLAQAPAPAMVLMRTATAWNGVLPAARDSAPQVTTFDGIFEAYGAGTGMTFGTCNLAIRRDLFERIGGFPSQIRYCEDNDMMFRASRIGPCLLITEPPMVGLTRGEVDHLIGDSTAAKAGMAFLLKGAATGRYPLPSGGRDLFNRVMAGFAVKLIRRHMETGHPGRAYGAYFAQVRLFVRARAWEPLLKLPFVPLLALIRPRNYGYFRWRPRSD